QLRVHHRPQHAAAAMRRDDADDAHARTGERTARHRELEGKHAGAAYDLAVLERRVHPVVRHEVLEAAELVLGERSTEVLADRVGGAAVLLPVGGGTDVEGDAAEPTKLGRMFRSQRRDVVFPQAEHAELAGDLALAWGNDEFDRPALPFDSFVRGVALHDRGYGELDTDEIGVVARGRWLKIQLAGF